jgi:hypothetical protein
MASLVSSSKRFVVNVEGYGVEMSYLKDVAEDQPESPRGEKERES